MSTLKVELTTIDDVQPHPNADRLELAIVKGWNTVVGKGQFKPGDKCIYFPIDSLLPPILEETLFGKDSKITLKNGRIKTIKIRGAISQGLVANPKYFPEHNCFDDYGYAIGDDLTTLLGVTKYEPGPPAFEGFNGGAKPKRICNPHFHKYTGIENFKNFNRLFAPDEEVVITEKIHGTNFRAGWVPWVPRSFWDRVKKFFGFAPRWEFVVGSHNMERDPEDENNVYSKIAKKLQLKEILPMGYTVYGEIFGPNIQGGYHYGVKDGEQGFVLFDAKCNELYHTQSGLEVLAEEFDLKLVPVLYQGPFKDANLPQLATGNSVFCPDQKVREGIVIRNLNRSKILKFISDEYLLGAQSEYH